ncbi:MAG: UDP-N-acetylmuramate dehydrogenase [Armatimonadota bacterium]
MNHIEYIKNTIKGYVNENEIMANHTTLGVGGPADIFVDVTTELELSNLISYLHTNNIPWTILGDGTNLLVSDKGIRGTVIKLSGELKQIKVEDTKIIAGAGARISDVADIAAKNNLTGLEGVGTVPGTVGGAIVMNAGTHSGYIDVVTKRVGVVTNTGEIKVFSKEDCGFTYRNSLFQENKELMVTWAEFSLTIGNGENIRNHLDGVRKHRAETQPKGKSAGCFFKNLPDRSAGKLIEDAGCKGMRLGGALVSDIHANFIINDSNATAEDLYKLAEQVRKKVKEKFDVELKYEVRLLGEW